MGQTDIYCFPMEIYSLNTGQATFPTLSLRFAFSPLASFSPQTDKGWLKSCFGDVHKFSAWPSPLLWNAQLLGTTFKSMLWRQRAPKTTFLLFPVFPLRPIDILVSGRARALKAMGLLFQTTTVTSFKLLSLLIYLANFNHQMDAREGRWLTVVLILTTQRDFRGVWKVSHQSCQAVASRAPGPSKNATNNMKASPTQKSPAFLWIPQILVPSSSSPTLPSVSWFYVDLHSLDLDYLSFLSIMKRNRKAFVKHYSKVLH